MHGKTRFGPIALFALIALVAMTYSVSASPLQDIPEGLADALDMGSTYVAEAILSTMVLVSVSICLAMLKFDIRPTIIILIVVMGALTAMGWLDTWVLVLVGVLTATIFASMLVSGASQIEG